MKSLEKLLVEAAKNAAAEAVHTRRLLHRHPEEGWMEYFASSLVATRLQALGYEVLVGDEVTAEPRLGLPEPEVMEAAYERALAAGADPDLCEKMRGGKTGVVGVLRLGEGPTVALRFDLDALPLTESRAPDHYPLQEGFASEWCESMHACGHDGHTAIGLGVAAVLAAHREHLGGTLKLLFQPAEEGVRGAQAMIQKGHLDDVDVLLGAHIQSNAHYHGKLIPCARGALATTKLDVHLRGRAAHAGSAPEEGHNVMRGVAAIIQGLYGIPRHSGGASRVNVGTVRAGSGRNVVADDAKMEMEVRGATTDINTYMEDYARRIIEGACLMHDLHYEIDVRGRAQSLESDAPLVALVRAVVENALPPGTLSDTEEQVLVDSEDISLMMARVQSHGGQAAFMRLLTDMTDVPHAHAFDFNEDVLETGISVFSLVVASILKKNH